ncbi:hypothetical protein X975_05099, partial [Stegodyphus mimosarum]
MRKMSWSTTATTFIFMNSFIYCLYFSLLAVCTSEF